MRQFTTDRGRINRIAQKLKSAFLDEVGRRCWFCGSTWEVHVHEIASGAGNRPLAILERFTWAPACSRCNCHELTDKGPEGKWPILRQLAVKYLMDGAWLKLKAFNRLRGHDENFITRADLKPWIRKERYRLKRLGLLR